MAATRISTTVITGFLGAGKTTLIRHLIMAADGVRLALIVNEFGDVGVDGAVLAECGGDNSSTTGCGVDDIIELANGCICCTVADDFLPSIEKLLAQDPPPDHIIIETSGLALPQPLVQAFNWPSIRSKVMLDGVVTVVDGLALAAGDVVLDQQALDAQRKADPELNHETPVEELFYDQVSAANLLVVSKGDLLNSDQKDSIKTRLDALTDGDVPVLMTGTNSGESGGRLDNSSLKAIFGLGLEDEAFARSKSYHHHHDDHDDDHHHHEHGHDEFTSTVITLPIIDDHLAFIDQFTALAKTHGVLRAKGFLNISGRAMPLVVQAVGARVEHYFANTGIANNSTDSRLVVIGLKSLDAAAIASALGGRLMAA